MDVPVSFAVNEIGMDDPTQQNSLQGFSLSECYNHVIRKSYVLHACRTFINVLMY
jgi:hypothetical protein